MIVVCVVVSWVGFDKKLSKRTCQVQRVFGVPGYRLLSLSKKGTLFKGVCLRVFSRELLIPVSLR